MKGSLEIEAIRQVLHYDAASGDLVWAETRGPNASAGSIAGSVTARGYRQVKVLGRLYLAHRLAWAIHFGRFPAAVLDHVNGCTTDNRLVNLREATIAENTRNRRPGKGPLAKGVHTANGKFVATIKHDGKRHHLGRFKSEAEAHEAYKAAAARLHGEFARFE